MSNRYAGYAGRMFDELLAAESRLTGARENFRAAVKDTGRETTGIFADTVFVTRTLMQARLQDLEATNSRALKAALAKRAQNEDDVGDTGDRDSEPNEGDDDNWEVGEDGKRRKKKAKDTDWPTKQRPIDDEQHAPGQEDTSPDRHPPKGAVRLEATPPIKNLSDYPPTYATDVARTAKAIVLAGRRRREGSLGSTAPAIKNEEQFPRGYADSVKATADMIIAAGKKRRNGL